MSPHVRIVAVAASVCLLLLVLELVRRRRLLERYALLWLACAIGLVVLSASSDLLLVLSRAIGVSYPPSALFAAAFFFTLMLLLHFSVAVSRQADQTKVLAQRLALDEERLARLEARGRLLDERHNQRDTSPIPQEVP